MVGNSQPTKDKNAISEHHKSGLHSEACVRMRTDGQLSSVFPLFQRRPISRCATLNYSS